MCKEIIYGVKKTEKGHTNYRNIYSDAWDPDWNTVQQYVGAYNLVGWTHNADISDTMVADM